MTTFNIEFPKNYSCGDINPFLEKDSDRYKLKNHNPFFEQESHKMVNKYKNYINDKKLSFSNNICNRYLATECQGSYKDIDLENKMVNLNFKSVRDYCPQKNDRTEYVNGIVFNYHSDNKLLELGNYINCRNLPSNKICAEPLCCDPALGNKLWNNLSKNK